MNGAPRFGTAGNPLDFYEQGYKHTEQMPEYLAKLGLSAYEYECGRGVKIKGERARKIGEAAKINDIALSLHAPYYISLSTEDEQKRQANIRYILESCEAVTAMGGSRVVVHCGSAGTDRRAAQARSVVHFRQILRSREEAGYTHVSLCPETMGKINQLGDTDEVLELAQLCESVIPCVDFGHLNARSCGGFDTAAAFDAVFEKMEQSIGRSRAEVLHIHFSKIEYRSSGEYRHLTFEDTRFGPHFAPCAEAIIRRGYRPVVICESDGTQAADAAAMRDTYRILKEAGE